MSFEELLATNEDDSFNFYSFEVCYCEKMQDNGYFIYLKKNDELLNIPDEIDEI